MVYNTFMEWWQHEGGGIRAALFDIDGTLISAGKALPGAEAALELLRRKNLPFFLLTNDGNHSVEEKSMLLANAGLHVSPGEIVSCAMALGGFAVETSSHGKRYFVLGELGVPCFAERAGLRVCRNAEEIDSCAGVIVGEGCYNWQDHISAALNFFIRHPDRPMLVPNPDSYWPGRVKGEFGIGAGAKARFICGLLAEMGISFSPIYLGKPYPVIFGFAMGRLRRHFSLEGLLPSEVVMVGDSLNSDIAGANAVGMPSALVLSGITSRAQAQAASETRRPRMIFNGI